MSTISDLITDSLTEIRAARAGDLVSPEDMDLGLRVLNRRLDAWNGKRRAVYSSGPSDFTLVPNLNPHTIGPTGTFVVNQRPVVLEFAQVNLGGNPAVFRTVNVREDDWYQGLSVPALTNTFPTDVFYSPDWNNGTLYFWPVPTSAYSVRLWIRVLLANVALTDTFSLPPGYQDALTLTLAEDLAGSFGQGASPSLNHRASEARALIFDNNDPTPRLVTQDAGMPGNELRGSSFNWRDRSWH